MSNKNKAYVKKLNDLKRKGFKVSSQTVRFLSDGERVSRKDFNYEEGVNEMSPFGGIKSVIIEAPNGKKYQGVSKCSHADLFNRKFGFAKAFWRAYGNLLIGKEGAVDIATIQLRNDTKMSQ